MKTLFEVNQTTLMNAPFSKLGPRHTILRQMALTHRLVKISGVRYSPNAL